MEQDKITRYTTRSGSLYEVNDINKTWRRLVKSSNSGELRTEEGVFESRNFPRAGEELTLSNPSPFTPGHIRFIRTSTITQINGVGPAVAPHVDLDYDRVKVV